MPALISRYSLRSGSFLQGIHLGTFSVMCQSSNVKPDYNKVGYFA